MVATFCRLLQSVIKTIPPAPRTAATTRSRLQRELVVVPR